MRKDIEKATKVLDYLQYVISSEFCEAVTAHLRRLTDAEVNTLYLLATTDWDHGDRVSVWVRALLPIIDDETDLRRYNTYLPDIKAAVARAEARHAAKASCETCPFDHETGVIETRFRKTKVRQSAAKNRKARA